MAQDKQAMTDASTFSDWDVAEFHTAKEFDDYYRHVEGYNVPLTRWYEGEKTTFTDENDGESNDITTHPVVLGRFMGDF